MAATELTLLERIDLLEQEIKRLPKGAIDLARVEYLQNELAAIKALYAKLGATKA